MSGEKRSAPETFGSMQVVKRQKSEADMNSGALTSTNDSALVQGVSLAEFDLVLRPRAQSLCDTSKKHSLIKMGEQGNRAAGLKAPLVELSGHSREVFCARFDPTGAHIASGSMDRSILLWNTSGDCANYGILEGHKSAILDLQWSRDSQVIYSASADKHIASWNVETGERIRRHVGHEEVINCLDVSKRGEEILVSGSDDGSISIWDPRQKAAIDYTMTRYPITAITLAENGNELFTGGIDNDIKVWDMRAKNVTYELSGHNSTITSLAISPDTQSLLSNALDSTVRTWDIRPFAPINRAIKVFDGARSGIEKNLIKACWDPMGKKVAAGGGDGHVTIWESKSARMLHKLPGHKGTVNDVRISPDGSMLLTASTDRTMLLGAMPL